MTLKTLAQRKAEKANNDRYNNPFGVVMPDVTKILIIYARQSSYKQFVENVYSAEEQRDGLLRYAQEVLSWQGEIIILCENELAKKTSARLKIDDRPGLSTVLEYVESNKAGAILVIDVSRLYRADEEQMVESAVFASTCKDHDCMVICKETNDIYDFTHPKRKDISRFVVAAEQAGSVMRLQSTKMKNGRNTKAEKKGFIANGECPIGTTLVYGGLKGKEHTLRANGHTEYMVAHCVKTQKEGSIRATFLLSTPMFSTSFAHTLWKYTSAGV